MKSKKSYPFFFQKIFKTVKESRFFLFLFPQQQRQLGQALIEFLLILAMVFFISLAMLKTTNRGLTNIWKTMIDTVARPSNVQFR